jgi:hypothetical protein
MRNSKLDTQGFARVIGHFPQTLQDLAIRAVPADFHGMKSE